jgi:hypothetical protein
LGGVKSEERTKPRQDHGEGPVGMGCDTARVIMCHLLVW